MFRILSIKEENIEFPSTNLQILNEKKKYKLNKMYIYENECMRIIQHAISKS